jgi:O-antigen ligase
MWAAMWDSYRQSPLIGHGYFVSSATGEIYVWYRWANWTAHNVALQALVTTGLVGAFLLAFGIGYPFFRMLRSRRADRHTGNVFRLVLVVGGWFVVWGLFNASLTGPIGPQSVVFFAMLGIAVGHVAWAACRTDRRGSTAQFPLDIDASWNLARS